MGGGGEGYSVVDCSSSETSSYTCQVVWYFHTAPETDEKPPSGTGRMSNNNRKLIVSTRSSMMRAGFYNVQACIKP